MWWIVFLLWVGSLTFNQTILATPTALHDSNSKHDEGTECIRESEAEAEALRHRIADLELQNQAILNQLAAIKARIQDHISQMDAVDLPPRTSPLLKLDPEPFEVHPRG